MTNYPGPLLAWSQSVWRQRWSTLIIIWIVCIAGWTAVTLWPRSYESSAVVYADVERLVGDQGLTDAPSSDHGAVEILKTFLLDETRLASLNAGNDLNLAEHLPAGFTIRETAPTLYVTSFQHSDPAAAHQTLSVLLGGIVDSLSNAAIAEETALLEAIEELEEKLRIAETNFDTFQQANIAILQSETVDLGNISVLEQERDELKQSIEVAVRERDEVAEQLAQSSLNQLVSETSTAEAAPVLAEEQEQARIELETQLAELRRRYADSHPYVSSVLAEIDTLNQAAGATAQQDEAPALVEASLSPEALAELQQVHEDRIAKVAELNNILANKEKEIDHLSTLTDSTSSVEAEEARLAKETSDLEGALAELVLRRDRAEQQFEGIGDAERTSFRLIDGPSQPDKPNGLSRQLCLALVLVGGVTLGSGIAVLRNQTKGVFESAWQLKQRFDVGVLGTVSEVLSSDERKQLGYARLTFGLGCLALVGVFGGLTVAEFMNWLTPWGDQLRAQLLG